MRNKWAVYAVLIGLLWSARPAMAHHGFAAEFDGSKRLALKGTVTRFEFTNPHAWLYMDVKNTDGTVTNWGFEMASPNVLYRKGWTRDSLKAGDAITVEAFASRDGSHNGNAQAITLTSTGQKLLAPQDSAGGQQGGPPQ
jgi:hypothetical protein